MSYVRLCYNVEKAKEEVKGANERADRIETYIKIQSDTLADLEEKATKLERKAEIVEQIYKMARDSGSNEALLCTGTSN